MRAFGIGLLVACLWLATMFYFHEVERKQLETTVQVENE